MNFEQVLADVFTRRVSTGRLDLAEERAAILAAKEGDSDATVKLIYAYAYSLRSALVWYTRAVPTGGQATEDIQSQAVLGLIEAVMAIDLDKCDRLAAIAPDYITGAVASAAESAVNFKVPTRSLTRFFKILREADGNIFEATALAPKYAMRAETFLAILSAVRDVDSYDGLTAAAWGDDGGDGSHLAASPVAGVNSYDEDEVLVEAAFAAVDDLEAAVCRDYYGFTDYNTKSDAEIAGDRGLSRPKVQRTRASALGKMRVALGVA
ncbi:RNA polymerase [Arthrobacter phage Liebe]|uniref:DNA binding protein n=2 Tax=Arthrobacter virus Liebe TaxID=2734245 RepID=A0A3G2KHS0_9CAUD|nr:RNA polymerase [Arthrobacter phage Liebe]AYN58526.1 DNA binding protein [Arthrobacter phage Maureen]AZF93778.1 DNA binding protein [Arthrobacter phage Liebe]